MCLRAVNLTMLYSSCTSIGLQPKARIISSGQGNVQYVSFNEGSDRIAACVGKTILILKAQVNNQENMQQY